MDFDGAVNWFVHAVSSGAIITAIAGFIPLFFAVPAFIYYCLLVSRDPTVKKYFAHRREKKIRRLQARIKLLQDLDRVDH